MPNANRRHARTNRRQQDRSRIAVPPLVTVTGTGAGTPTTSRLMTFSGQIRLSGQPTGITAGGASVTLTPISGTVLNLAGAHTIAGQAYNIPTLDPAVRTPTGGYVAAKAGTF